MSLLKDPTKANLSQVCDEDLIIELRNRGIELDYITGCYYALGEMEGHRLDEIFGYSEDGLHGAASDLPKKSKLPIDETGDSN